MEIIFALVSSLFASLTAIFIKIGLQDIDSNLALAIRTVVILIMSWTIVFYINSINSVNTIETVKNLNSKTITFLIFSGVSSGLSWLFYFKALQIGKLNKVAAIDKLSIVFTIILASVLLKEDLNIKTIIGIFLISSGAIIVGVR